MQYSESTFRCESPEKGLDVTLQLGAHDKPIAFMMGVGGYKSTLSQVLACTIAGEPPPKTQGYRKLFDSLIWLGEGATGSYRYGDKEKTLLLYPYNDSGDNHMEFGGESTPISVIYLANMGDVSLGRNLHPTKAELADIDERFHTEYERLFRRSASMKAVRSQLNIVVPSSMTHATCLYGIIQSMILSEVVIADFYNPGLPDHTFREYLRIAQNLAQERQTKLICFFPRQYQCYLVNGYEVVQR